MVSEVFFPGERLGAVTAAVRRFAGVLANVVGEMLFARKRLRAEGALVWRLSRVLSNVVHCK